MSASKITLEVKKTTCKICANADQRALRKLQPHCRAKNAKMRNGHCTEFETLKPKAKKTAAAEVEDISLGVASLHGGLLL